MEHIELLDYLNHPTNRTKSEGLFSKESKRRIEVMRWELEGLMDRIIEECLQILGLWDNNTSH
jgi:hypothetical protein